MYILYTVPISPPCLGSITIKCLSTKYIFYVSVQSITVKELLLLVYTFFAPKPFRNKLLTIFGCPFLRLQYILLNYQKKLRRDFWEKKGIVHCTIHSLHYPVIKTSADFAVCDLQCYCKALCDVKFSQTEKNLKKCSHKERHQLNVLTLYITFYISNWLEGFSRITISCTVLATDWKVSAG